MGFLVFLPFLVPVYFFSEMFGAVDMGLAEGLVMSSSAAFQAIMEFFVVW